MRGRNNSAPPISLFSFQDIITSVIGIMVLLLMVLAIELVSRKQGNPTDNLESEIAKLRDEISEVDRQIAQSKVSSTIDVEALANLSESSVLEQQAASHAAIDQLKRQQRDNDDALASVSASASDAARSADAKRSASASEMAKRSMRIAQLERRKEALKSGRLLVFNPQATDKTPWLTVICREGIVLARPDTLNQPRKLTGTSNSDLVRELETFVRSRDPNSEYFVLLLKPSAVGIHREIEELLRRQRFELGWELIGENQTVIDTVVDGVTSP